MKFPAKKAGCLLLAATVSLSVLFAACSNDSPEPDVEDVPDLPDEQVSVLPQDIPDEELAGNIEKYALESVRTVEDSSLSGKTIYWLGSSVTYGDASFGEGVPDYVAKRNGCTCIKEAVSGTTLMKTTWSNKTYVDRLLKGALTKDGKPDLFICQLSTNDMYYNMFGEPTANEVRDISSFNKNTTCGAIEYIIAYAQENFDCKVAFYSNPYFEYKNYGYGTLVGYMKEIAAKWDIDFWNMYDDPTMKYSQFDDEKLKLYMRDWIHPTRAGYLEWWTPYFETKINDYLNG